MISSPHMMKRLMHVHGKVKTGAIRIQQKRLKRARISMVFNGIPCAVRPLREAIRYCYYHAVSGKWGLPFTGMCQLGHVPLTYDWSVERIFKEIVCGIRESSEVVPKRRDVGKKKTTYFDCYESCCFINYFPDYVLGLVMLYTVGVRVAIQGATKATGTVHIS